MKHFDMLVFAHGVFRLMFLNRHPVGAKAWRSAQPAPHQIRALAQAGVRTIVNLRGAQPTGSYWLEEEACRRHGITLVNFQVRSRDAPSRQEIAAARQLFTQIDYPMLMHCKSGADRAGLMSVLYCHSVEGVPMAEAARQLSFRYGHIRQADTGILDAFFAWYLADNQRQPMPFYEWVATVYDADELKRSYRAKGWANGLVNAVLRRE